MAGGGTGGHVLPALAVARELRGRGHQVHFIGVERGLEAKLVPAEKFPIDWIEIGGLKRVGFLKTIETLAELPLSIWHASRILSRLQPAAVFSVGGYVAGPVLLAAISQRIPFVVMEPNATPGFTHRKLGRFADRALVSFAETKRYFHEGHAEVTGMPIRPEFFAIRPKEPTDTITVLITGGSQGSRTLNNAARASWPLWAQSPLKDRIRLIQQSGTGMFETMAKEFAESGLQGEVKEFITDMPAAFAQADIVVSRSGMGTVSELAAAGKPAILVPLPTASDNHQFKNAWALEQSGAAKLVLDSDMNGERLVKEIETLVSQPGTLAKMSQAIGTFAKPGAAQRASDVLESLARLISDKAKTNQAVGH